MELDALRRSMGFWCQQPEGVFDILAAPFLLPDDVLFYSYLVGCDNVLIEVRGKGKIGVEGTICAVAKMRSAPR